MSSISRLPNPILEGMGFDSVGLRQPISVNIEEQLVNTRQYFADNGIEGQRIENLSVGKLKAGTLMVDTYLQSTGYVAGTSGWRIDGAGNAEFASLTLTGGTIRYGKTSFIDSTNAGYYISADGFYIGAASDTTKLKYTLATGLFDFIGTISSRSTATVASAINSSGNLITDVINARLDSAAATILSDFDFGSTNYAGAVNAGGVTWNTTTGAITGGSGVILYRKGILGVNAGATTFSIDATTGAATFAGTLSAPTGTLGSVLLASSGYIRLGQTAYNTGIGFWLGDDSGTAKFSIGDSTTSNSLTWDGSVLSINGSSIANNDIFGSGVDGAFALDGTNTYATYYSKSGSTYTQLMDVFATTMTLSSSAIVITNGYRLFCKTSLTIGSGSTIKWNGNNGSDGGAGGVGGNNDTPGGTAGTAGAGGAALTSASLYGSLAGLAGTIGGVGGVFGAANGNSVSGSTGTAITSSFASSFSLAGANGGTGGTGGGAVPMTQGSGGTGTGGATGTITASSVRPYNSYFAVDMFDKTNAANLSYLKYNGHPGGASGGGGGGAGSTGGSSLGAGGGGGGGAGNGSNGGTVVICAKTISHAGAIEANGGDGGTGGAGGAGGNAGGTDGGGGGGGGGGRAGCGGVVVVISSALTGSGTVTANAGTAGAGGAAGTNSGGGNPVPTAATVGVTPSASSVGSIIYLTV